MKTVRNSSAKTITFANGFSTKTVSKGQWKKHPAAYQLLTVAYNFPNPPLLTVAKSLVNIF
jgi:hypothetical protein